MDTMKLPPMPCPHCGGREWVEGWVKSYFMRLYWKKPDRFLSVEFDDDPVHPDAYGCVRCGYVMLMADPVELASFEENSEKPD